MSGSLQVAVIGAGAAGLCAARHMAATSGRLVPTIFEQSDVVGGTWVFTPTTGTDQHGLPVHSSMYKHLRTNLPKEIMAFPDFPFDKSPESFVHHGEVRRYLERYASHHALARFIKFGHTVTRVHPRPGRSSGWDVTARCLAEDREETRRYDGVLVCSGHYSAPSRPDIAGMDRFTGVVMHSHDYRDNGSFRGRRVAVLGAASSGTDIGLEIAAVADRVYLSHNNPPFPSPLPSNMDQCSGIKSCDGARSFLLHDGTRIDCDCLVLCTGYRYTYPFLTPDCDVRLTNRQVRPLYKHLIHTEHPTLAFVGIPFQIVPFPQFDLQVRLYVNTLLGKVELPTREEMDENTREEMRWKVETLGMAEKHFHKMGSLQWGYNNDIADLAGEERLPQWVEDIYNECHARRQTNLVNYKNESFTEFIKQG